MRLFKSILLVFLLFVVPKVNAETVSVNQHFKWAIDKKTSVAAKIYMLGVRDSLYSLPLKNKALCVNDEIIYWDDNRMLSQYIQDVLKTKSNATQWMIIKNVSASTYIAGFLQKRFPHPNCKI